MRVAGGKNTDLSNLPPAEQEQQRRSVRRERNKLAAAKCRQRRVDLTNNLITESDQLEEEQSKLENDITNLTNQKDQLEFILEAHRPVCKNKCKVAAIETDTRMQKQPSGNAGDAEGLPRASTHDATPSGNAGDAEGLRARKYPCTYGVFGYSGGSMSVGKAEANLQEEQQDFNAFPNAPTFHQ